MPNHLILEDRDFMVNNMGLKESGLYDTPTFDLQISLLNKTGKEPRFVGCQLTITRGAPLLELIERLQSILDGLYQVQTRMD